MKISQALEAAYRSAAYCVSSPGQDFVLRIGKPSQDVMRWMDARAAEGAVFITAWNPFGVVASDAENLSANAALRAELMAASLTVVDGYGASIDNSWREDSFFACPVSKPTAVALCVRHAQNAVVFVGADGIPELVFHPRVSAR